MILFEKHPKKKGMCPKCKTNGVFRYYESLDRDYGKCERINHCGYWKTPDRIINQQTNIQKHIRPTIVYPNSLQCQAIIENQNSNFHSFCLTDLSVNKSHFFKWNIGTRGDYTAFIYTNKYNYFVNVIHIQYLKNGKRNKIVNPFSLTSKTEGTKFSLCLFGEHLIKNNLPIALVESEKTAFICSFFYPQFNWLATGGCSKLTLNKLSPILGRKILYFCDADLAGRSNSSIGKLNSLFVPYIFVDLFPDRNDGYDLADSIINKIYPNLDKYDNYL